MNIGFRRVLLSRVGCFFLALAALGVCSAGPGSGTAQAQVAASDAQTQFPVGGLTVALPAPPGTGMVELGNDRSFFDPAVPGANRLIAAFVLEKDVAALHNGSKETLTLYAMVEASRATETTDYSASGFKDVVDTISMMQVGTSVDSSFKESEAEFKQKIKAMNLNEQVSQGKRVMLGTFFYKTDACAFGEIAPVTVNGQAAAVVVSTVLLRTRNRVLYAYFYEFYKDDQTPGQVRATSEQWADAILAANQ